jgi:putative transposase
MFSVVRYVERNALRANLAARAEEWPWSSLRRGEREDPSFPILSPRPLPRPMDWLEIVNRPQSEVELNALRRSVRRGSPFGSADWIAKTAKQLGIEPTVRPWEGREKNHRTASDRELSYSSQVCQIRWMAPFILPPCPESSRHASRASQAFDNRG